MTTPSLWLEDINDALREIVRQIGRDKSGYKVVGCKLWPEKSPEAAGALLANCLNIHRPERLTPEQTFLLFRMVREAGYHAAKRWFDEATGYVPGEPMEPETERARLQREFISAVEHLGQIEKRLEQISAQPVALRVAR